VFPVSSSKFSALLSDSNWFFFDIRMVLGQILSVVPLFQLSSSYCKLRISSAEGLFEGNKSGVGFS